MEIGQEIIDVSEETRLENQTTVTSQPCDGMIQEVAMNLVSSEVNTELCDDISVNVDEVIVDVSEETRLENQTTVTSEPCDGMIQEIETNLSGEIGMNLVSSEVKSELSEDIAVSVDEAAVKVSEPDIINDSRPIDGNVVDDASPDMGLDELELKKTDEALACSIQKGLEKVSLATDNGEKKSDEENKKTDSSDSESETSSASSSTSDSSSSSDEEESDEDESEKEEEKKKQESKEQIVAGKENGVAGELEEGEIESVEEELESNISNEDNDDDDDDEGVDEMIAWSNDEDEDLGLQTKEPIRSKNELKELPPVPAVDVTLEPHHVTVPAGVILSVLGTQVVVMGCEKHHPLKEGSILWITESRIPLGWVDELFGPVKCPYYIVRYNTESEVPEGISEGTSISFVADFAEHIAKIEEYQTKAYDASGDHDEEVSEHEFSDDDVEIKHRQEQKKEKRGMNEQRTGNKRNKKKKNKDFGRSTSSSSGQQPFMSPNLSSNQSDSQPPPHMDRFPPNNGAWRPPQSNQQNPYQQQLPPMSNQMGMANLLPMQLPMIPMQNQMASPNQMMFQQQQFNNGQMPLPNLGGPGGLNFFGGQGSAPWSPLLGQNCFNQPFSGIGINGQPRGMQQQQPPLPNELNFNLFAAAQSFQMQRPPFQMQQRPPFQMQRPQFQNPMNQHFQMHPPQSPINQQFQIRPQSETSPQSPINQQFQPETDSHSQGFSSGSSPGRGRSHRGRGRGRGRGRFGRGRGRQHNE